MTRDKAYSQQTAADKTPYRHLGPAGAERGTAHRQSPWAVAGGDRQLSTSGCRSFCTALSARWCGIVRIALTKNASVTVFVTGSNATLQGL